MKLILEVPDEILAELYRRLGDPTRSALEALAATAYWQSVLSLEQVRRLLGFESSREAEEVLSKHGAWPGMELEDFREDLAVLASLRASA